ncbi:hypothetical protein EXV95_19115 [Acidovorax sp. JMULE5]|uniref:hypothetical protein n=1 Tax=Acidovorax sp. JMULE5 TaxID=2518343 RepID=UPI0015A1AB4E|nr:hypothetical protein [Acidovorax sp. JMULE5]QLA82560.1 hypothetical protein EXV95_19115 [Acidovorax sp. JMULE5]
MPIDIELREAVHQAIIQRQQPLELERQLLALLAELSEQDVTDDRRMQRVSILQSGVSMAKVLGQ